MVYVHFADGFEEIEAVTIVDVLRRAGVDTKSVSVTGSLEVCGSHDIKVRADMLIEDADYNSCEMIVLPGGMPGTTNLLASEKLRENIVSFAEKGKRLAAICAAPMVFGKLGVLKGKKAVIYPGMEENLTDANVCDRQVTVVTDGNITTSRGPGTALGFSLELVEILKSEEEASRLRKAMIVD